MPFGATQGILQYSNECCMLNVAFESCLDPRQHSTGNIQMNVEGCLGLDHCLGMLPCLAQGKASFKIHGMNIEGCLAILVQPKATFNSTSRPKATFTLNVALGCTKMIQPKASFNIQKLLKDALVQPKASFNDPTQGNMHPSKVQRTPPHH